MLFVKPAVAGTKVPFPKSSTRFLKPEGEEVPEDRYWLRRLEHGDIVVGTPPAKPSPPVAPAPPAASGSPPIPAAPPSAPATATEAAAKS
jgi:hypothetical protein